MEPPTVIGQFDQAAAKHPSRTAIFWGAERIPYEQLREVHDLRLYVRCAGNAAALISTLRKVIQNVDPNVTVDDPKTLELQIDEDLSTDRLLATLSAFFSGLAVLLASIGLYGVMAYTVVRRTHDIGIRMARKTEWTEVAPGEFHGLGQRILSTDSFECALMDARAIEFGPVELGGDAKSGAASA